MKLKELKEHRKGIHIVQVTPFNRDGSVDLEGMRANTRWLIERFKGRDCIFTPVGTAGEFYSMSEEECQAVIKIVVEEVNGRFPVMPGAGRCGTLETIKVSQYAQSVGADGVQVILPYYFIPQEEGMYLHFKQLAESLDINFGIVIYNQPDVSGSWIKPSLMKRLSKIPNIILVKECTPFVPAYCAMLRAIDPEDLVIFCGSGEIMFSSEAVYGCPGFTSSMSNFAPDLAYSVYEAAAAKDFGKLTGIIDSRVQPYFSFRERMVENHGPHTGAPGRLFPIWGLQHITVIKAAMDIIGLRGGEVRLPVIGLTDKEKAEVRELLKVMKVI